MENYSNLDKLLHKVALSSPVLNELIFDIEKALFLQKAQPLYTGKSVFVLGLARAGTTTFMREIYGSGEFASLTYQDMPFVMSPNIWERLTKNNKKRIAKAERAHGDGILVDTQSPEALEEVFWKTFHAADYISEKKLVPHTPSDATLDNFELYQKLVCLRYDKHRYLSKNNNNILRVQDLARRFSGSEFFLLFRDPVTQAQSLLKQHRRFSLSPSFVKDYMFWLSHFEFGDNHRPFTFSKRFIPHGAPDSIEYWLSLWYEVYSNLLLIIRNKDYCNIHVVNYENLCLQSAYWKRLCDFLEISYHDAGFRLVDQKSKGGVDESLIESTYAVYNEMMNFDQFSSVT